MKTRMVQLGEVLEVDRTAASAAQCRELPYVGLEHIESDSGCFTPDFRRRTETLLATKFCFTPDHVLYGKLRPYLNKTVLPDFAGVCTTEILPLRPLGESLDRKYLHALLLSRPFVRWASDSVSGANLPRLDPSRLCEYRFPLPSLPEQRRIAAMLEHADRLRRTRRYALELSDSFLPAAFLEMFGNLNHTASSYKQTAFGEIVASAQLGLVRGSGEMHPDFEYAYLRMDSILGDGRVSFANLRRVKASDNEVRDFRLNYGDFLFNTRNSRELVGKTGLVVAPPADCLFNNNIMRIRFQDSVTPEYMMGLFQCPWLQDNLERIKSGTTSVFAVYYKDLTELPVLIPPLPLQQRFADMVRGHERLRATQRESLRQAEHLFQSLLHRVFAEASC